MRRMKNYGYQTYKTDADYRAALKEVEVLRCPNSSRGSALWN
jgi:hypothetical protein